MFLICLFVLFWLPDFLDLGAQTNSHWWSFWKQWVAWGSVGHLCCSVCLCQSSNLLKMKCINVWPRTGSRWSPGEIGVHARWIDTRMKNSIGGGVELKKCYQISCLKISNTYQFHTQIHPTKHFSSLDTRKKVINIWIYFLQNTKTASDWGRAPNPNCTFTLDINMMCAV